VSNSETLEGGGVGMVTFNKNGEVIDYGMIVTETKRNCGGGKTPWNTWVTCEENKSNGQIYEVDPFIGRMSQQKTILGGGGGNYESFGFDARDPKHLTFYVTTDSRDGGLLRFTPDSSAIVNAQKKGNYGNVLTSPGLFEWLVLEPVGKNSCESSGKFRWTLNKKEADRNAKKYYPFSEGIDTRDGLLFFTCKKITSLFILNLDEMTYTKTSTKIGKFDGQPDTIVRILSEDDRKDMLYFCEDGPKTCGIHARNKQGNFFHILEGEKFSGQETTGLAFSPDNKRLYVCFQDDGIMFEVSREDGYAFDADLLDVR
jgi:secreted PhoX family phosphatase